MLKTLTKIEVKFYVEKLAEHALASGLTDKEIAQAVQQRYLEIALKLNRGNKFQTALQLGRHRNTLDRDLRRFGIEVKREKKREKAA